MQLTVMQKYFFYGDIHCRHWSNTGQTFHHYSYKIGLTDNLCNLGHHLVVTQFKCDNKTSCILLKCRIRLSMCEDARRDMVYYES